MSAMQRIYETVAACDGLSIGEIAELNDVHRTHAGKMLEKLMLSGKVRRSGGEYIGGQKGRSAYRYHKGDGTPQVASERKQRAAKVTNVGWEARLAHAQARIAELEEWKAAAIKRYPDLGIAPEVLHARRIAAKANPDFAAELLAGNKDNTPIMRAVLAAIEELAA